MLMESPLHISEGGERHTVGNIIYHMFSNIHSSESTMGRGECGCAILQCWRKWCILS